MKQNLILLLTCITAHTALGEPSLAEKNATGNRGHQKGMGVVERAVHT